MSSRSGNGRSQNYDDDDDGKNPNRVRGGKDAASKRDHQDFVEMGRKGAQARWGGGSANRSQSGGGGGGSGGGNSRGRRGSNQYQRKGDEYEDEDDNEEDEDSEYYHRDGFRGRTKRSHEALSRAGKKGAAAVWGRSYDDEDNEDEEGGENDEGDNDNEDNGWKNPNRVRGGKQAVSHRSRESLSRAGQKGAAARWGRSYNDDEDEEDDGGEDFGGKNPNRVRAGKQAASHRSHEELSEQGRKGAAVRWGGGRRSGRQLSYDDDNEDDRSSKRRRTSQSRTSSPMKTFVY